MTGHERGDWHNHSHWDHSGAAPPPPRAPWDDARLKHLLRRAHVPVHPAAPLMLIVLGAAHCVLVARLFEGAFGGDRATFVATAALATFALAPGIGLVLTGAWDLARQPLRVFARRRQRHGCTAPPA